MCKTVSVLFAGIDLYAKYGHDMINIKILWKYSSSVQICLNFTLYGFFKNDHYNEMVKITIFRENKDSFS